VPGVLDSDRMARMAAPTTRDRILEALQDLPADATVDDAIERLVFLAKIDAGLAELDEGKGIPHEEVKRRLGM
jgi:predicted transcriptional regulator